MQGIKIVIHHSFFEMVLMVGTGIVIGMSIEKSKHANEPKVEKEPEPFVAVDKTPKKRRAIFDKLVLNLGKE